jgi:hypothetical protein
VCKVSEGVRVDKLRGGSSFMIPWRRTQEKVRTGRSFRAEENLKEEESTTRSRRGALRSPADRQILEKLRGIYPLGAGRNQEPSGSGLSGFAEVGVSYLLKSQLVIPRHS